VYALADATQQKGSFVFLARSQPSALIIENELIKAKEHRFAAGEHILDFIQAAFKRDEKLEFELLMDSRQTRHLNRDDGHSYDDCSRESSVTSFEISDLERKDFVNRPPPPDYNKVIEQRCNSLRGNSELIQISRQNPLTFLNISNFSLADLYERNFTRQELEALIDIQDRTLDAQKAELVRMESTLINATDLELIQLRKQHNNLQTVLNSLRNGSWQEVFEAEKAESERLDTAIAAMNTAIKNKERELYEALQLQKTIESQVELKFKESQVKNQGD